MAPSIPYVPSDDFNPAALDAWIERQPEDEGPEEPDCMDLGKDESDDELYEREGE